MSRGKGDAFQRRRDRDSGGRKARVPSQAAKGKACTAAAGSGAEHCGSPGGRKWTVACKRTRAARPLTRRAESTRRSAARPKRGAEIPGSRRARCAERLSTEFGKRGEEEGRKGGEGATPNARAGSGTAAPQARRALCRSQCAPPCAPPSRAARLAGARLDGVLQRRAAARGGREGVGEGRGAEHSTFGILQSGCSSAPSPPQGRPAARPDLLLQGHAMISSYPYVGGRQHLNTRPRKR